jgi:hypothetical protein
VTEEQTELMRYWRLKAAEGRAVAGCVSDPIDRLALLKIAEIYERFARRSERGSAPVGAVRPMRQSAA